MCVPKQISNGHSGLGLSGEKYHSQVLVYHIFQTMITIRPFGDAETE